MGCECYNDHGYVSHRAVTYSNEYAFKFKCSPHGDRSVKTIPYPTGYSKNVNFLDEFLDVYCSDGDLVDVVGTSTIPGANYYADKLDVWFYKQNGAMAIMEATDDSSVVTSGYNKQVQLSTRLVKKSERYHYRDLIRNGGIGTGGLPQSAFDNRMKAKHDVCESFQKITQGLKAEFVAKKLEFETGRDNMDGLSAASKALPPSLVAKDDARALWKATENSIPALTTAVEEQTQAHDDLIAHADTIAAKELMETLQTEYDALANILMAAEQLVTFTAGTDDTTDDAAAITARNLAKTNADAKAVLLEAAKDAYDGIISASENALTAAQTALSTAEALEITQEKDFQDKQDAYQAALKDFNDVWAQIPLIDGEISMVGWKAQIELARKLFLEAEERYQESKVPMHICIVERDNSIYGTCAQNWEHKLALKKKTCENLFNAQSRDLKAWSTCHLEEERLKRDTATKLAEDKSSGAYARSASTLSQTHAYDTHQNNLANQINRAELTRNAQVDTCAIGFPMGIVIAPTNQSKLTEYQKWYTQREHECKVNPNGSVCRNMQQYEQLRTSENKYIGVYDEALENSKSSTTLPVIGDLSIYKKNAGVADTEYNLTAGFIKLHSNSKPHMTVTGQVRYSVKDLFKTFKWNPLYPGEKLEELWDACAVRSGLLSDAFKKIFDQQITSQSTAPLGMVYEGEARYTESTETVLAKYSQINVAYHQKDGQRGTAETMRRSTEDLNVRITTGVSTPESTSDTLNLIFTADGGIRNCDLEGTTCNTVYRTGEETFEWVEEIYANNSQGLQEHKRYLHKITQQAVVPQECDPSDFNSISTTLDYTLGETRIYRPVDNKMRLESHKSEASYSPNAPLADPKPVWKEMHHRNYHFNNGATTCTAGTCAFKATVMQNGGITGYTCGTSERSSDNLQEVTMEANATDRFAACDMSTLALKKTLVENLNGETRTGNEQLHYSENAFSSLSNDQVDRITISKTWSRTPRVISHLRKCGGNYSICGASCDTEKTQCVKSCGNSVCPSDHTAMCNAKLDHCTLTCDASNCETLWKSTETNHMVDYE